MKKLLALLFGAVICFLTGCGSPKDSKALIKMAVKAHGDCEVISQSDTEEGAKVELHDKLQDFNYVVTSGMTGLFIDGTTLGHYPKTSDTFEKELAKKVFSNLKDEMDKVCADYKVTYETEDVQFLNIYAGDEESARKATEEMAKLIQTQNLKNRLDNHIIYAYNASSKYDHFGSVKLPETSWRSLEDERIEFFTNLAHESDKGAKFLRIEKKKFSETGYDIKDVVQTLGEDCPKDGNSMVTLYYFESSEGSEFYIGNFYVYDENRDYRRVTNYKKK